MLYKSILNNNIFIINYKCGFSTFEHLKYHEKIIQDINLNDCINNLDQYNFYIIVRNPIKRFISYYKDKFIQAPRENKNFDEYSYGLYLNKYFQNYNFNNYDFTTKKFNINILCEMIKNGFDSEDHLVLQSQGEYNQIIEKDHKINIIKMEDKNFNSILCDLFNYNENIIDVNNTKNVLFEEIINDENLLYLKKLFNEDFDKFDYDYSH